MGYDAFCLVTEWPPAVVAYRETCNMDFYWLADEPTDFEAPTLPYAVERHFWGGWAFQAATFFYESLRPHLPGSGRETAEGFLRMIYPETCGGDIINDLAEDAGVSPSEDDSLWYSMRPGTVVQAVARADALDWSQIGAVAGAVADQLSTDDRYMPDVDWFRHVVDIHAQWLREAAETGRGAIVLVSY